MGEINLPASANKGNIKRVKKLSTRVDLTPMVDLGFLLITFFIFTTSMSEPTALRLKVPKDTITDSGKVSASKTLNMIIAGNDKLVVYGGTEILSAQTITYKGDDIRKAIINKQKELTSKFGPGNHLCILIKPTQEATYEGIVNVLDEMTINGVTRYVLMEPSQDEIAYLIRK
jgi:biopolymer transport protein ExbD